MATSWTLTDLERIEAAIASGARVVRFEDREVEYRSAADLLKIRELMRKALGITGQFDGRTQGTYDKGLNSPDVRHTWGGGGFGP